ncbi:MAG: hypothetical protein AAFY77_00785 [Pseudomonadota bacterium]
MRALALIAACLAMTTPLAACPAREQAVDVEIYPTAPVLPSNLLRMYIYFPRAMGLGDVWQHVVLLDATGTPVTGAFLENRVDLWSPDRRRLTLLLNPGRVKTNLAAHEALGRALEHGERYALRVGATLPDAEGCPLGEEVVFEFTAGAADIERPRPGAWVLTRPALGTREPLAVDLGSAHDHLSLAYRLRVYDGGGAVVPGAIDLGPDEASWSFVPSAPWQAGDYALSIDERLEDLAGNRPSGLFDRPIGAASPAWQSTLSWRPR